MDIEHVSYEEEINQLLNTQPPFVGGQTKLHIHQWREITTDPFVLSCIEISEIEFDYEPLPARHYVNPECKFSPAEQQIIDS